MSNGIGSPGNVQDPLSAFGADLARLINEHSLEGRTDTPDFLLAEMLVEHLRAFEHVYHAGRAWHSPAMSGALEPIGPAPDAMPVDRKGIIGGGHVG